MLEAKLQQELKKQYNPEGSKLRKYQLLLLDMMIDIDNICKDNNIQYWITFGTMLGAYRHGGFIPWDDDLDIAMPHQDYKRFKKILKNNNKYILQSHSNDLAYVYPFGKIRLRKHDISINEGIIDIDYNYKTPFIDVFPMVDKKSEWANKLGYLLLKCTLASNKITSNIIRKITRECLYIITHYFIKPIVLLFSKKHKEYYGYGFGCFSSWEESKKSYILPTSPISFEGQTFQGPGKPHEYLREIYGNYEELPRNKTTHLKDINN